MGEMMRLHCSGCGIDRNEFLGIGMSLEGQILCACYGCRRFVRKRISLKELANESNEWATVPDPDDLRCPYCRKPVKSFENGDACPVCESTAVVEWIGIWD